MTDSRDDAEKNAYEDCDVYPISPEKKDLIILLKEDVIKYFL